MRSFLVSIYVILWMGNQLVNSTIQLWYETQMSEKVIPAYIEAFKMLRQNILNPLLANIDKENEIAINELVFGLTCSIQRLYHDMNVAVDESRKLHIEVDHKLIDVVASVSAKERETDGKKREIQQKTIEIQGVHSGLIIAERALRDKQQALVDAENAVRIAEEKVDKAKRCLGRRRRKRFLGFLRRVWRKFIVHPICAIVNMGGIHIAKAARGNANGQVQYAQNQVNEKLQQLSGLQVQKSNLNTQLDQLEGELRTLKATLTSLKDESNSTAIINYELKRATSHLTSILDSSTVLYYTIKNLVNFELLITPLNAIYTELTHDHLLMGMSVEIIHKSQLVEAKASLDKLTDVLPQMPFNTALETLNCDAK